MALNTNKPDSTVEVATERSAELAPDAKEPRQNGYTAVLTNPELNGPSPRSQWGHHIRLSRAPAAEPSGVSTSDDVALLQDLGVTRVVITLEWSELSPAPNVYDTPVVEAYLETIRSTIDLGVEPWLCLVDGTLPGWFAYDEGGFTDAEALRRIWPRHVDWAANTFDDLVAGWVPQREPIQHVLRNELLGLGPTASPPAPTLRGRVNRTATAAAAAVTADALAIDVLAGASPVAIYQTSRLFRPSFETSSTSPGGSAANDADDPEGWCQWLEEISTHSWARALTEGSIGIEGHSRHIGRIADRVDRVVLQLRPPVNVRGDGRWQPTEPGFLLEGMLAGFEASVAALDDAQTENLTGAADLAPVPDDGDAQAHYLSSLVTGAREVGATDWWMASPIDGWQWERGYLAASGILDRDRQPRAVAEQLGDVLG